MQRLMEGVKYWCNDDRCFDYMNYTLVEKIAIVGIGVCFGLAHLLRVIVLAVLFPIWIIPYMIYKTIKEKAGK